MDFPMNKSAKIILVATGLAALLPSSSFALGKAPLNDFESKEFKKRMGQPENPELFYDFFGEKPFPDRKGLYRAVGRIEDLRGNGCTATLIGKDQIVTSASCLKNTAGSHPSFLLDNGMSAEVIAMTFYAKPDLKIAGDHYDGFVASQSAAYNDMATATLDKPLGNAVGWHELYRGSIDNLRRSRLQVAGYPLIKEKFSKYVSKAACRIAAFENTVITANCFPRTGLGGGPLFAFDLESKKNVVVATVSSPVVDDGKRVYGATFSTLVGATAIEEPL
jgi:V8-like Glu-specific endopeptidase